MNNDSTVISVHIILTYKLYSKRYQNTNSMSKESMNELFAEKKKQVVRRKRKKSQYKS